MSQLQKARELIDKSGKALSVREAAMELKVSKTALYSALKMDDELKEKKTHKKRR